MQLVKLLKTLTRNHASPPKYRSVTHVFLKYLWDIEKKHTTHVIISLPIAKTNIISQVQNPYFFSRRIIRYTPTFQPSRYHTFIYSISLFIFGLLPHCRHCRRDSRFFASFFSIHINLFTIHQWIEIPCNGGAQWPAQYPRNDHKHSVQFDEDRRIRQFYIWIIGGILC